MQHILFIILFGITSLGYSQNPKEEFLIDSSQAIFGNRPEKQPIHSSGSDTELTHALYGKLENFCAAECLYKSTALLSFNIDTLGIVVDPKILRSIAPKIDNILLDEICNHTFMPGELYGKKVETSMHLPIRICLK